MLPANSYVIRLAGDADEQDLLRIAELDSAEPLEHPILVGEIGGEVAAAFALDEGRAVANPFKPTATLVTLLRMRAGALEAYARTPRLSDRIRAALNRTRVVPA